MGNPSAERGNRSRRRLLDAAAALIPELGWGAVSTRNLAERAGVRPGLIHYHFTGLADLLRQAALDAMRRVLAEATEAGSATEMTAGLLTALDGYSGDDPTSLLFVETYLAATRDEQLHRELAALVAGLRDALTGEFAAAGVTDPSATAAVVMAALDGLMLHRPLGGQPESARLAAVLTRLLDDNGSTQEES